MDATAMPETANELPPDRHGAATLCRPLPGAQSAVTRSCPPPNLPSQTPPHSYKVKYMTNSRCAMSTLLL